MTTEHTPPSENAQKPVTLVTPVTSTPPLPYVDSDYAALEETGFSHVLNNLLKKPLSIIYELKHREHQKNIQPYLLLITLVGLAIFGLVLGMFSGGNQLWAAPVKIVGGVLFSSMICLPSLYIFGALGGMDAKIQDVIGIMITFLAITALLLVGFAPVLWLFSTSSDSLVFFGFLSITLWILCLVFGLRIITRASRSMGGRKGPHLIVWSVIFLMVTLQMTTTLRPIIGSSEKFFNTEEKHFFLGYWLSSTNDDMTKGRGNNSEVKESY